MAPLTRTHTHSPPPSRPVYVWYMVLFPMHTQGSLVAQLFHSFMAVVLVSNLFYHYYSVRCCRHCKWGKGGG